MAFALLVSTESGDDYMFAFDGQPTQDEIIEKVKNRLGEEAEYITSYGYDATYDIKFKMPRFPN